MRYIKFTFNCGDFKNYLYVDFADYENDNDIEEFGSCLSSEFFEGHKDKIKNINAYSYKWKEITKEEYERVGNE